MQEYWTVLGWVLLIVGAHMVVLVGIRLWFNRMDRQQGNKQK